MFPIIVLLQSCCCTCGDTLAVAGGTLVEVFSDMFPDLLGFEWDGIDDQTAVATVERDISTLRVEVILSFFTKRWDVYEIGVGSRHEKK
jgi:hypothetical protein